MPTKVFISWSGDRSKEFGESLCSWLPSVLQNVRPYFTPNDIQKGAKWSSEISKELESSDIGIICLTKENKEKPWILFEAGALAKKLDKSKVCTLLFEMTNSDLSGPLTQFQSSLFEKQEIKKLLYSINEAAEESAKVDNEILNNTFEMCWPKLEQEISSIISDLYANEDVPEREDREIIEELLELVRDIHSGNNEAAALEKSSKNIELEKEFKQALKKYSDLQSQHIDLQSQYIYLLRQHKAALEQHKASLKLLTNIKGSKYSNETIDTVKSSKSLGELLEPNKAN